jgi:hypothetical protein
MKNRSIISLLYLLTFVVSFSVHAEIVIKQVRTPSVSTNRPGIIVPGPGGGITNEQQPQLIELLDGDILKVTLCLMRRQESKIQYHSSLLNDAT